MESIKTDKYFKFNPNTLQDIRRTYNLEKPGAMNEAIDILEEWLKKQDHFVKKDFDRDYLERTIIRNKGSIERSKHKMDKLCTSRSMLSSFFFNGKVTELDHLDILNDAILPRTTPDNYRVYLLRNRGTEFDSKFYTNYWKRMIHFLEYQYANDYSNGIVVIFDFREANLLPLVKGFDLVELQNMVNLSLDCYGVRVKGIHLISNSKVIEMLVTLLKQILSAKVGNRISVHKSLESLHEHVQSDILPVEYGGKEKPLSEVCKQFIDEITSAPQLEYIKMMNGASTNEAYRQTDKFNEQCLGMPGTFRTLKVD